jgi:4-hydroxybutyryl-CoA dehydratase/vinylacetyl-CoA-Delta-isomerase
MGDVLIGAAQTIAEYNGVAQAPHVRDKITEMNHLNETIFCCSLACAYEGSREACGTYYVNSLMANITKLHVTRIPYELAKLAQEIAGGALVTVPSERDFRDPKIGKYVAKYLQGVEGVPAEHRIRMLRLIESLTMGLGAACYLPESMHGAGSPQAQKIMIGRQEETSCKEVVRDWVDNCAHPLRGLPRISFTAVG